jgi:hypothetical protein
MNCKWTMILVVNLQQASKATCHNFSVDYAVHQGSKKGKELIFIQIKKTPRLSALTGSTLRYSSSGLLEGFLDIPLPYLLPATSCETCAIR